MSFKVYDWPIRKKQAKAKVKVKKETPRGRKSRELDENTIKFIRKSNLSLQELAAMFNFSPSYISNIRCNKTFYDANYTPKIRERNYSKKTFNTEQKIETKKPTNPIFNLNELWFSKKGK